ncbi:hypothetical protein K0M31_018629, partial [Melipona bicolor]
RSNRVSSEAGKRPKESSSSSGVLDSDPGLAKQFPKQPKVNEFFDVFAGARVIKSGSYIEAGK